MAVMQINIGDNEITEHKKEEAPPVEEPKQANVNTINTSNSSTNINKINTNMNLQQQQQPQTRTVSGKSMTNLFGPSKK